MNYPYQWFYTLIQYHQKMFDKIAATSYLDWIDRTLESTLTSERFLLLSGNFICDRVDR
jgi:hypothetical protein